VTLTALPLRGGDAICIDAPGTVDDLVIDGGDESAVQRVVTPFLRAQGRNRLPTLVLTHGDVRHVGGAPLLASEFQVRRLITSPVRFRSPAYREAVEALSAGSPGSGIRHPASDLRLPAAGFPGPGGMPRRRCEHVQLTRGDRFGAWRVLHPDGSDRFPTADDAALVLLGEFRGVRVLLCSDLGREGQQALLDREKDLRADVVIAAMPAAGQPLSDALLDTVQPQAMILSTGEYPAKEQASLALRGRLGRRQLPVFYTADVGAVELRLQPSGATIRTLQSADALTFPRSDR
jgi:beta-lactamase superfamily II metal-dependent hydrolase